MKARLLLTVLTCAATLAQEADPFLGPPAPLPPPPVDPRDAAKREAWTSAVLIVSLLEEGNNRAFPGIRAWLADFARIAAETPPPETGRPFPPVDADALVTRNPNFWAAFYEVQPGDPGFALLHAGLLLAGGEAQRAAAIAAFGLQRPSIPEEVKRGLLALIAHSGSAQARCATLVRDGVRRHDRGDFAGALECFDAALAEWPAHGGAHYERGSSLRMKALAEARAAMRGPGDDPPEKIADPRETVECFARARRHDPLHLLAYQGDDPALRTGLMALVRAGLPAWEAMRRNPEHLVKLGAIAALAEACHEAAIDDFALVLRQLLVAANRHYGMDDREFIAASLQRLAPAAITDPLLARVGGETRLAARQIVVPITVEPPEPTPPPAAATPPKVAKKKETPATPKSKGKTAGKVTTAKKPATTAAKSKRKPAVKEMPSKPKPTAKKKKRKG